jgi:hypothetical protein
MLSRAQQAAGNTLQERDRFGSEKTIHDEGGGYIQNAAGQAAPQNSFESPRV